MKERRSSEIGTRVILFTRGRCFSPRPCGLGRKRVQPGRGGGPFGPTPVLSFRWPRDRREKLVWGPFAPKFDCETLCKPLKTMAGTTGLEPATSAATERPIIIKYLYLQSLRNRRNT